jgi:hypothetical protein
LLPCSLTLEARLALQDVAVGACPARLSRRIGIHCC